MLTPGMRVLERDVEMMLARSAPVRSTWQTRGRPRRAGPLHDLVVRDQAFRKSRRSSPPVVTDAAHRSSGVLHADRSEQPYDDNNIFARILRGELPSRKVHEDDTSSHSTTSTPWLQSIFWQIPKGCTCPGRLFEEVRRGDRRPYLMIGKIARDAGLVPQGYRVLTNIGLRGGRKCRTFTSISSAVSPWGRCSRASDCPSHAEPLGSAANTICRLRGE